MLSHRPSPSLIPYLMQHRLDRIHRVVESMETVNEKLNFSMLLHVQIGTVIGGDCTVLGT